MSATFKEAMEAIKRRGTVWRAPVENSSTGIITDVYDLMGAYDNYIVGEYVVKVELPFSGFRGQRSRIFAPFILILRGCFSVAVFLENMGNGSR